MCAFKAICKIIGNYWWWTYGPVVCGWLPIGPLGGSVLLGTPFGVALLVGRNFFGTLFLFGPFRGFGGIGTLPIFPI